MLPRNQMKTWCPSSRSTIVFWLGVLLLSGGCKGYTNRLVLDPAPAVARLRAGGKLQAEVDCLAQPLVTNREVFNLAVGVLTPDARCIISVTAASRCPVPTPFFKLVP